MHKKGYDTHAQTSSRYPTEEWGNLPEVVIGDRKCGMSLNIFADSAWNDGNRRNNDVWLTGAFTKSANPPINFELSVRPSVHSSVRPSTCMNETSTGRLYVKFDIEDPNKNREIPGWSQSSINRHFTRRPKCVIFFPATLKLHVTFTFELNLIRLLG